MVSFSAGVPPSSQASSAALTLKSGVGSPGACASGALKPVVVVLPVDVEAVEAVLLHDVGAGAGEAGA